MDFNQLNESAQLVIGAVSKYGVLTSDVVKKEFHVRSERKVDSIMRRVRGLEQTGILTRVGRGAYTMSVPTQKETRNIEKIEKAIKSGKQITIEGKKTNGDPVIRLGSPEKIEIAANGHRRVILKDVAQRGWRSFRTDLIDKVKVL